MQYIEKQKKKEKEQKAAAELGRETKKEAEKKQK